MGVTGGELSMVRDEWPAVADIGGNDSITQIHVGGLLTRNKIPYRLDGSKIYYLHVPPIDATRAVALIQSDAPAWGYSIGVYDPPGTDNRIDYLAQQTQETATRLLGIPYESVISLPEYAENVNLGAALRQFAEEGKAYPIVSEIRSVVRLYLDDSGNTQTGDEFEIILQATSDTTAPRLSVSGQVWDHGKGVTLFGSSESA
jgi:hypothetical protein